MTNNWKRKLFVVVFEADTPAGKWFDVALLVTITMSVIVVMLESVEDIRKEYYQVFITTEWVLTILFTVEYFLRIIIVYNPKKYIFSFLGLVDLFAILPSYLGLFLAGTHMLVAVRVVRLLRIFRIFKLTRYLSEASVLTKALKASRPKITVFLVAVISLTIIVGTLMYLIEGKESGFTSIPTSIYWAIVTLTTVGFGDIVPATVMGKMLASTLMIMGYGILAVPTGIVSVELAQAQKKQYTTISCSACLRPGHDPDAQYCKFCGGKL